MLAVQELLLVSPIHVGRPARRLDRVSARRTLSSRLRTSDENSSTVDCRAVIDGKLLGHVTVG